MAKVVIKNVRISFPVLFNAEQFNGDGKPRYSASFLVEPGSDSDKLIRAAIKEVASNKWGAKAEAFLKSYEPQPGKYCYQDGNLKEYDGYQDHFCLAAHRNEDAGPPRVVDQAKNDLSEKSGKPYAGCYVNAVVDIWAQTGQYPGIRATLVAVQFAADGDAFAGSPATADDLDDISSSGDGEFEDFGGF